MAYGTAHTRAAAAVLAAAALAGCGATTRSAAPTPAELAAELKGSPPALAALHRQGGALLDGGADAFRARLRALRGYPVVVMQWGSDCVPCQHDFPYFQRLSASLGRRVAFLGNDLGDSRSGAVKMLRHFPVSFPSYRDAGNSIALALNPVYANYRPMTYFYTPGGKQWAFAGPFLSEQRLRAAIRRYAGV